MTKPEEMADKQKSILREKKGRRSGYFQLLNSIASDLDVMLNDICKTFPYPGSTNGGSQCELNKQISRESEVFEEYMRGAEEDDDFSSESLEPDAASSRSDSGTTSSAEFFSLEEDQASEAAMAGSELDTPPPIPPLPPAGSVGLGTRDENGGIPVLEKLIRTHPIWYLPNIKRQGAVHLLHAREEGAFLVRQASQRDTMALSVRVREKPKVDHYLIESTTQGLRLEKSEHCFKAIPFLIAYYCQHLEELPVQLVLPHAIMNAKSNQELTSLALLGQDFWTSSISRTKPVVQRAVIHARISPYQTGDQAIPQTPVTMANSQVTAAVQARQAQVTTQMTQRTTVQTTSQSSQTQAEQSSVATQLSSLKGGSTSFTHVGSSAFIRPPAVTIRGGHAPYHGGKLEDRMSDYEDIWTSSSPEKEYGGQFFQPIRATSSEESLVNNKKRERLSHRASLTVTNPVYRPDSGAGYPDNNVTSPPQTERVLETQTTRLEQIVPSGFKSKHEPIVFTFDYTPPVTRTLQCLPQLSPTKSNISSRASSKFSSPAYAEPYDSRIGKVQGVTQTQGAIKVSNVLKAPPRPAVPPRKGSLPLSGSQSRRVQTAASESSLDRLVLTRTSGTGSGSKRAPVCGYRAPVDSDPKICAMGRSQSLRSIANQINQANNMRAKSLPRETEDRSSPKPPRPVPVCRTGNKSGPKAPSIKESDIRALKSHLKPTPISKSMEENFFQEENLKQLEEPYSPHLPKFPVEDGKRVSVCSDHTTFSDTSTVEDVIHDVSPELTLKPITLLTRKNLQRISDYDNMNGGMGQAPVSQRTAPSSAGTHYCTPWDSSLWQDLLNLGNTAHQPRFPFNPAARSSDIYQDAKESLDNVSMETDYSSVCGADSESGGAPSEVCTSELATSFEWRTRLERDSVAERVSQPIEPVLEDSLEEQVSPVSPPKEPISDDEGVGDDNLGRENFKNHLMQLLSPPRVMSLRNKKDPVIKVRKYVSGMSQDMSTTFGVTVDNFIKCTKEGHETSPHIVVRNVRQFMNGIKNYLAQTGEAELNALIEKERSQLGSDEFLNVDAIIEGALHKCVVKPLKQHIYKLFVNQYKKNGNLQVLSENISYARTKTAYELGIRPWIVPPQGASLDVIKHFLAKMQKAYSPLKKLENLLGATSSIINSVQAKSGSGANGESVSLGADDFLPMFIYVLVECGVVAAEIEADYMWGLLHPCLLTGEGGYYLTTLSSAVHVLKNLKETMESTDSPRLSSIGDLQGFMKIIIPNEKNDSIITNTLPVRPNMNTREVCSMIAHKFKITNPQDYNLYILINGVEDGLQDNSCPQAVRDDVESSGRDCIFAYKRINARFAWPKSFKK